MNDKTSIQFINHASILVKHGNISLLSDPWYQGDIFHKGWNLTHEFNDDEISNLLDDVSHIWISHEHPDHFSVLFFKKFGKKIKDLTFRYFFNIVKTKELRVFFLNQDLN